MIRKIILVASFLGIGLLPPSAVHAQAASTSTKIDAASQPAPLTPAQDSRLSTLLTLHVFSGSIENILKEVSDLTKVTLTVAPEIAERRLFVQVEGQPLYRWMEGVAWVTHAVWQKEGEDKTTGYRLCQTAEQKQIEAIQLQDAQRFIEGERDAQTNAVLTAIQNMLRLQPRAPISYLLATLNSDELNALAQLPDLPLYVIAAGGSNDYLYDRIYDVTPFDHLPNAIQQLLRGSGLLDSSEEKKAKLGFFCQGGTIWLCLILSNNDLLYGPTLNMPGSQVSRKGLPGYDMDDDSDPEADAVVGQATVEFDEALPPRLQKPIFTFPSGLVHNFLPVVLLRVHVLSGLPIICDDFAASRMCHMPYLLTDQPRYTLLQALTQVARVFSHQFLYFNGMLVGRTVALGRDLRDEPPPDLVEKMSSWLSKQRCIDWNDLQAFGKLTDAQVDLLWYQRVNENLHADIPDLQKGREPSLHPVWNRWALRLLASLTPQQRQQAESPAGLSVNGLTQEQRTLFELVANTGVDVHALPQSKDKRPVLYLQENRWPNGVLRSLQLHTVDLEPYCHETFVTLLLNSTAQGGYSGPVH